MRSNCRQHSQSPMCFSFVWRKLGQNLASEYGRRRVFTCFWAQVRTPWRNVADGSHGQIWKQRNAQQCAWGLSRMVFCVPLGARNVKRAAPRIRSPPRIIRWQGILARWPTFPNKSFANLWNSSITKSVSQWINKSAKQQANPLPNQYASGRIHHYISASLNRWLRVQYITKFIC